MPDHGACVTREHAFRAAQNAVRNQGYAVALHGSQVRDLDLIAIPWRQTAINAERCAEIIANAIPGVLLRPAEEKPYGRLAWEIHPSRSAGQRWGHGFDQWYVDLSVMPRAPGSEARMEEWAYDERWRQNEAPSTPEARSRDVLLHLIDVCRTRGDAAAVEAMYALAEKMGESPRAPDSGGAR